MTKQITATARESSGDIVDLAKVSQPTGRKERFWLKGKVQDQEVYSIPIRHLYFNIKNGRYADKMIQLSADHPAVVIDPRQDQWKSKIMQMLKGQYPGTEADRDPFLRLRADIMARHQLRPGVVLHDGGVLDGNRRLSVLLDLASSERNPGRFEYFDGVILPTDVGPEDRWRIEAGLQIGRDEKLDYSPINQLLKVREGLELFRGQPNPEKEIAKTLWGVPEKEVKKDILKVTLIDEYLEFIKKPLSYNLISRLTERFEEAVNVLEDARRVSMAREQVQQLKVRLFCVIRDGTMDNWEMRTIRNAIGAPRRGARISTGNDKALADFIKLDGSIGEIRDALASSGVRSPLADATKRKSELFVDKMEAARHANAPLRLAMQAKVDLEELQNSLSGKPSIHTDGLKQMFEVLEAIFKLARECLLRIKNLK